MDIETKVGSRNATPKRLVWIDLEMTGLDTELSRIVEVAVIITDFDFRELATYHAVIHQSEDVLLASNDFSRTAHEASGLYSEVRNSSVSEIEAEQAVLDLISQHVESDSVFLAGNSIRADRAFIDQWWPRVAAMLHYRMLDVSSFKLLWLGKGNDPYEKPDAHRALDDIRSSIAELSFYLTSGKLTLPEA